MNKLRSAFSSLILFSLFLLSPGASLNAQTLVNYAAVRNTGITFSSIITTGIPPSSWRNTGTFVYDDNRSYPFDIGFDFWYNGIRYTQVSVSTNGYLDFSTSTNNGGPTSGPYGYSNTQFTSASGTLNAIAPMYDDMTTQGATNPLGSGIRSLLSGTAPNRVLTIEWTNMAVYQNTTPNLNFQAKLYETTGRIEFCYGTMTQGTANFTYTCGLNAATMSGSPTAAQLKCQQTANSSTFSNGQQNNLSALPAANSRIQFTPPTPANPAGALTFSAVQAAQMTLNWTNWATNEVGYVIYNSTDGINYDFITQTAANATSATVTGLFSGTTYYWRVYAVTEGWLSNALSGTQATLPGTTFISANSGNWSQSSTWVGNNVPGPNDNVIITGTHIVTITTNASCHNLTIGQGGASTLRFGNNNNNRTLTVSGNLTVAANATLTVNTGSNTTHTLNLYGNLTNNGTVNLSPDANSFCDLFLLHPYATQLLNGTGATNRYNFITVDKGDNVNHIVDVQTSTFSAANGFLTLLNGTFKISTTGAVTMTPYIASENIPASARLWLNSSTATVNTTGGSIQLYGMLTVTSGTLNIGNAVDNNLTSNGGLFTMNGGTVSIAGRYDRSDITALTRFTITAGTLIVNTTGSTSNTNAPFMMDVYGSQFTQSGGTIIIRRYGGTGATRLGFLCTGGFINQVTGGVLQIGDALTPVAQTIQVNSVSPVGAFRVASANATASLVTNPLTVITDVELQSGIFLANNLNVTVGRDWVNSGGTYTAGTNTTTFNGAASPQLIWKTTGTENFNHIAFSNAGVKTLGSPINCRNVTINSGATFSAGATGFLISTSGNWLNNGSYIQGTVGTIICNGTTAQTIGGSSLTTFRNLTIQNAAGVSITADENIRGTLTLTAGMFTTTGHNFTLVSNTVGTARIGPITGGDITGNIVMQRHVFNGPTQWRQMGAPVSAVTLQGWDDDMATSGFPGSDYPSMSFYSVAVYNEAVPGVKELGYSAPASITDPIAARKGYFVYVGPLPVPVDVTGPPLKNLQTFTLTRTVSSGGPTQDGWNMVANPYPSTIDWDSPTFLRTGTDNVLQTWNPALAQYSSYVGGVGVNGGTRYIASSQAFWIHAIAANPTASINETVKSAVDATFLHSTSTNIGNLLSLTLTGSMGTDQSIVRFDAAASDTFDVNFDAYKLASMDTTMPYLSSRIDSVTDLAINALPSLSANLTVPLHVTVGVSGNYSIQRDSISDLPYSTCVILEDLLNGTITQLTQNASYSFYMSDTTSAVRFLLHFGPSLTVGDVEASCGTSADGKAFAQGTGNGPWDYTWKDLAGNVIAVHNAVTGTDTAFGLTPGNYIVEVNGNDGYCSFRADTVAVHGPDPIQTGATITPATCSYTNDGEISLNIITGGNPPYTIEWPDGSTADSLQQLVPGSYALIITDANGCVDTAEFLVGTSSTLVSDFTVSMDTVILQSTISFSNFSSGASSFEWNFGDGSPLDISANPFYSYSMPGVMTVTLVASDSICTDTSTQTVYVFDNTGVIENAIHGNVSMYGGQDVIGVQFNLSSTEHALINIYDAGGNLIASRDEYAGQQPVEFDMKGKAAGIYSVYVVLPGKTYASKVVLLH